MSFEKDPAAVHTAMTLLKQYGNDASVIATLRAAEIAAMGDAEALVHWDQVIAILEAPSRYATLN